MPDPRAVGKEDCRGGRSGVVAAGRVERNQVPERASVASIVNYSYRLLTCISIVVTVTMVTHPVPTDRVVRQIAPWTTKSANL